MSGFRILMLVGCGFCAVAGFVLAQTDTLPLPRILDEGECKKFSPNEFERLLLQMRAERDALQTDWKAVLKRSSAAGTMKDLEQKQLQAQLRLALQRLRRDEPKPEQPLVPEHKPGGKKSVEPAPGSAHKQPSDPHGTRPETTAVPPKENGPVDVLSQAHALFRLGQYEEALTSFRSVDLKGKKADSRAPIQYLTAMCLLHLNKTDEALPVLREVANSRGDERLAAYAQWELENLRWQGNVQDRLSAYRQRRLALERKQ